MCSVACNFKLRVALSLQLQRFCAGLSAGLLVIAAIGMTPAGAIPVAMFHLETGALAQKTSHVQPYQCGVTSSKFARICRPQAAVSCASAVSRGISGFSEALCKARQSACSGCLVMLRRCISRIGHAPRSEFSCDKCTGKFSRCIGRRYPVVPH